MAVTPEQLKKLTESMPYKWREQSVKFNKAQIIAYIDARQLFDKLDEVCGAENWQTQYQLLDGNLFGGIGIYVERMNSNGDLYGEWVWKWDVGSESNVEKEKGNASDSVKRAGIHWGIGRFLYSLGIVTLNSKLHTNGKEYPCDRDGNIFWDKNKLTEYCTKLVNNGTLDDTKGVYIPKPNETAKSSPSVPSNLPYLNQGTENYTKVEKAITEGKATIKDVKTKYKLSKAVEESLTKLVK